MVAKFLDNNKPKTSLKKWIHTVSNLIDLIQCHLICQKLAKFPAVEFEGTDLSLEKEMKKNIFVLPVFTYSIKQAREIRRFHVTVVQPRLRNVQKSVMHVQSCCFANINYCFSCRSRCRRRLRYLSSLMLRSRNFATMVTWRHTSPLSCLKFIWK